MALESMDLEELVDNFEFLEDWEERYRYIIELGRKLPPMSDTDKTEANKVRGCMSQVWMISELEEGTPPKLHFIADSDAHIVKGLIALILMLHSGKTPQEILAMDIGDIFAKLGLNQHLSANRRNGFQSMLLRIKQYAQAHA